MGNGKRGGREDWLVRKINGRNLIKKEKKKLQSGKLFLNLISLFLVSHKRFYIFLNRSMRF